MNNFYIISGCSSGGKSTLLAELSKRGHPVVPEAGRLIAQEQASIDGTAGPGTALFGDLIFSRSLYFYNQAVKANNQQPVFFDRSILEHVSYWWSVGKMAPHLENAIRKYRYANTIFMAPPWPEIYETDAERQHGFDSATKEYERSLESFTAFGYDLIHLPKDTVEARADFVESTIEETRLL